MGGGAVGQPDRGEKRRGEGAAVSIRLPSGAGLVEYVFGREPDFSGAVRPNGLRFATAIPLLDTPGKGIHNEAVLVPQVRVHPCNPFPQREFGSFHHDSSRY